MRISDWSSDVCSSDLPSELLKAQDASIGVSRGGSLVRKPTASYEKMLEDLLVEGFDLAAHEQMMVELALRKAGGNLAEAATMLNMSKRQLTSRLHKKEGGGPTTHLSLGGAARNQLKTE